MVFFSVCFLARLLEQSFHDEKLNGVGGGGGVPAPMERIPATIRFSSSCWMQHLTAHGERALDRPTSTSSDTHAPTHGAPFNGALYKMAYIWWCTIQWCGVYNGAPFNGALYIMV